MRKLKRFLSVGKMGAFRQKESGETTPIANFAYFCHSSWIFNNAY